MLKQLGPDQMPIIRAQVPAHDSTVGRGLDGPTQGCRCRAFPMSYLIDKGRRDHCSCRDNRGPGGSAPDVFE